MYSIVIFSDLIDFSNLLQLSILAFPQLYLLGKYLINVIANVLIHGIK